MGWLKPDMSNAHWIAASKVLPLLTALFTLTNESEAQQARTRPAPPLLDWRQTAEIEHFDRMNRLRRLSDGRFVARPEFHEYLISRQKVPQFGVDLKLLRVVFAQSVFFDTDKYELRAEGQAVLDLVADSLRRDVPDVAVFVAGHTDSRGSDEYNYDLSVKRADTVARALFSRGIGLARMWRVGFGESVPLWPNTTDDSMARNRRVEFLISAKPEVPLYWLAEQDSVCTSSQPNQRICRLAAVPVDRAEPSTISPRQEREVVTQPPAAAPVGGGETKAPTAGGGERADIPGGSRATETPGGTAGQTVTVGANNPVIIDLKEKRVEVGRPQL